MGRSFFQGCPSKRGKPPARGGRHGEKTTCRAGEREGSVRHVAASSPQRGEKTAFFQIPSWRNPFEEISVMDRSFFQGCPSKHGKPPARGGRHGEKQPAGPEKEKALSGMWLLHLHSAVKRQPFSPDFSLAESI